MSAVSFCTTCKTEKPYSCFYLKSKSAGLSGGVRTKCKACDCAQQRSRLAGGKALAKSRWKEMKRRVSDPSPRFSKLYRDRGITVSPEWMSFDQFFADMGQPPTKKHQLDRIDNSAGYCKSNCRWATSRQQINNRSTTLKARFNGELRPITEIAEELGINAVTIKDRIYRGLPKERWLERPKPKRKPSAISAALSNEKREGV